MAPRHEFSHVRDDKHLYKLKDTPGPGTYQAPTERIPVGVIKKDIHPEATMMSRIPDYKTPGP
jgi:hypothetical protein